MRNEFRKRIFTSFLLMLLLTTMYLYSFIMIISLIVIATICWIEFYAIISKIIKRNKPKDILLRFLFKAISLLYLSLLVFFILSIESHYPNLKFYLLYSILISTDLDL